MKEMKKLRRRIKKQQYTKIEKKKMDLVDKLQWDFIKHILHHNDVIHLFASCCWNYDYSYFPFENIPSTCFQ
jgi:hypothetical protein